jgi:hypothetical protein
MTDEELIARLRLYGSKFHHEFGHNDAADRIEALTAKLATCEKYRDAYAECDRIGTQAVRDLEAKLAKAVEALEKAATDMDDYVGRGYGDCFRDTLAEIKGEKP